MKNIILLGFMLVTAFTFGQVRIVNTPNNTGAVASSAFLDASSNPTMNLTPNVGKGLLFPRTDLTTFTFSGGPYGRPNTYPSRYDGFIVYNTATSGVALEGATEGGALFEGFWYYENKSTTSVTAGKWIPVGAGADVKAGLEPWFGTDDKMGATSNTENIYQMGSVGIGTDAPTQKLEVIGNAQIGTPGREMQIGNMGYANHTGIAHKDRASAGNYALLQNNLGSTYINASTDQSVQLRINNELGAVLDKDKNFGIGIAPTQKLDVGGGVRVRTLPAGAADDQVVVADANGVLKKVLASSLAAAETLTTIAHNEVAGTITYKDEDGTDNVLDLNTLIDNAETLTTLTKNDAAGTLTYKDEDGTDNVLDLNTLIENAETTTSLAQNTTSGVITYTDENVGTQTANVRSADANNLLTVGADGGAFIDQAALNEPWFGDDDDAAATTNTEDIYHMGSIGVKVNDPQYALDVNGSFQNTGHGLFSVMNGSDDMTINKRGIYMWDDTNNAWGIYMSRSGLGRSLTGDPAIAATGGSAFNDYAIRFRVEDHANRGFIFENSNEELLMSIRGDGFVHFEDRVRVNNLPLGAAADQVVVADATGLLKKVLASSLGSDDQVLSVTAGATDTAVIALEDGSNVTLKAGNGITLTEDTATRTINIAYTAPTLNVTTVDTHYTILPTDDVIEYTGSAPATFTPPSVADSANVPAGKRFYLINTSGTDDVTFDATTDEFVSDSINAVYAGTGSVLIHLGNGRYSMISGW